MKRIFELSIVASIIAILLVAVGPFLEVIHPSNDGFRIQLKAPAFVQTAYAQDAPEAFDIGQKLDDEAGISAYFQSPGAIDLTLALSAFRTVEIQTADYIIGSVAVPSHPENFDAHVYVHKDGWVLAYYMRADPTSKIVDVLGKTINSTKLTSVLAAVAGAAGIPFSSASYYDFRYPNATNMLFVAEDYANGHEFEITLPTSYGYFERGWAVYDAYPASNNFKVDGIEQTPIWSGSSMLYGTLTAAQLLPGTPHLVWVSDSSNAYGVVVITYRVP